jgi:hypothetical protein
MRIVLSLFAVIVFLNVGLQATYCEEPAAQEKVTETKCVQQYTVECRYAGKGKNMNWTLPIITLRDGEKKLLEDVGKKTVVFRAESDVENNPIKREVTEGTTIEVTVIGNGKKTAVLDFSLQLSGNPAFRDKKDGQVRWLTGKSRVIECVTLGKKTVASFADADLEFVVKAVPEKEIETASALQLSNLASPKKFR